MAENEYKNEYKVLITTSGIGQRLGELTQYTNKALVRVGKKPVLSYIIESYPKEVPLVITVGHFARQVQDFVRLAHPERKVEFVEVDNYQGKESSLGYSMLKAKDKLQCPFIFHACDTIVETDVASIPEPDKNWVGVFKGEDAGQYASWKIIDNNVLLFNDKGAIDFDYIHIGLVGIKDYQDYWKALEELYARNPNDSSLNDCRTIVKMLGEASKFDIVIFSKWFDTGNTATLYYARENIDGQSNVLDKIDESIFIYDNFVIKFFYDEEIVKNRVKRAEILKGLVPEVDGAAQNFYRYKYIKGDLYSRVVNPADFVKFLDWAKNNLWHKTKEVAEDEFKKACYGFYYEKTKKRIQKFLQENALREEEYLINGERVPVLEKLLDMLDFDWLTQAEQYRIHGDFILDNVLRTPSGYCLLDWRQDFGGLLEAGDIYYDLAKLNHNLVVNHDIVNKNLFSINVDKNAVSCDILRKENLVACQEKLFDFFRQEGYDAQKIKILTALIWLNMSPLHHHPFNLFLYYFGKLNLWRTLKKNQ